MMKRKRHDSSSGTPTLSSKILCLQNGSNVEVQLDDGKWHSGTIVQCQARKYLVQVEEQQYWSDVDLIRSTSGVELVEKKRTVPFEYRPGQFLRNESKSPTKVTAEEKVSPSSESSTESSRKRVARTTAEQRKSPFVWKPSTISTIQTRRSSKNGQVAQVSPEEVVSNENHCRTRASSNPSKDPPADVLIFRPIIRFVESSTNGCEEFSDSSVAGDLLYQLNTATDSRSSSRTSTDNPPYPLQSFDSLPVPNKSESKGSSFLETPPPSLPDIHLTQDSESPSTDKHLPPQQLKSKRKQERPQRKPLPQLTENTGEEQTSLSQPTTTTTEEGYLSDEYSEPVTSTDQTELEAFAQRLSAVTGTPSQPVVLPVEARAFYEPFLAYLWKNEEHYQQIDQYRRQSYGEENTRLSLISLILKELFFLARERDLTDLVEFIPEEIQRHLKVSFNAVRQTKKLPQRVKRSVQLRQAKTQKSTATVETSGSIEQQMLLSPSSPLTPLSGKLTEELLSPNVNGTIEELTVLPKERDVYEIIHCLCQYQVDNGFMIQCETCLCWSHCECVGVTTTCIPAFFKCSVCTNAQADRPLSSGSFFDDDLVSHFHLSSSNAEKMSLVLSYSRRLWDLREQMIELKLRSTPELRTLQHALRSDDLLVLSPYTDLTSEQLLSKANERQAKREHFQSVVQTLDSLVNSVAASINTSRCPSIDLSSNVTSTVISRDRSSTDLLICQLCDDEKIREIRSSIATRYERAVADVERQIQSLLLEHQTIQREMQVQLGLQPDDVPSDRSLAYEKHHTALRTALERLKS